MDMPNQERRIGSHVYKVSMLPLGRWLELEALLLQTVGPAIAQALAGLGGRVTSLGDVPVDALAAGLEQLARSCPAMTQERLLEIIGEASRCDERLFPMATQRGHWPHFMRELVPFIRFALEVQFSDFFGGLLDLSTEAAAAGPSPSTSSGSGASGG